MQTAKQLQPQNNIISGAPEGHDARILAAMARDMMPDDKVLIHIAIDYERVQLLKELLAFFATDVAVLTLPSWDCLPYDRVSPKPDITAERVSALCKLKEWDAEAKRFPRILLTTVNAMTQKVMPRIALEGRTLSLGKNIAFDEKRFLQFVMTDGYLRTDTVREQGEYAMRGGIIDIFPSGIDLPIRIDLFGDEVESIKFFDPATQLTTEECKQIDLYPATEFFMDDDTITRFRTAYREYFGATKDDDPLYNAVSEGRRYSGVEHWLPLFFDGMETVVDYAPRNIITCDHHTHDAIIERQHQIADFYKTRKDLQASKNIAGVTYNALPANMLYVMEEDAYGEAITLSPFKATDDDARKARDFTDIRKQQNIDLMGEIKSYLHGIDTPKLIACYSKGSRDRIEILLDNAGIKNMQPVSDAQDIKKLKSHQLGLCILPLPHGFVATDLSVLTEQDMLGDRLAQKSAKRRKKADNFLKEVSSLNQDDLIVHIDHGIGRFVALETVKVGATLHDCLKLSYLNDDKLYVPVENMDLLSRFGGEEATAKLDKLGSASWQARKAKVKENLMAMADDLLKIASARQLKKADKLTVTNDIYNDFSSRFPYTETEDQERAIEHTLSDLEKGYPMDRLICGDVGFGKTEVALRAAYVAAMDGAQVAVVVPTTLLARQHYKNFVERFQGTGLRIDQLSRMVTSAEANKTREGLKTGDVNIVVGTHALFSDSVKFNNLALLVIDEEQRFGVKQKEKLKTLKENVHVLTLSATPIPRTLQMSLTGVKELSLIMTPPVDRMAVRTFILPYDPMVIREALMRERYRGGQSFYVCPRIKDMDELEKQIKELVPEISIVTAHGQMSATELDDRMSAFYEGQYDLLLATNIIESGIDIPTANTMVIHRADMFGLSQLYQIRGRIGRSKTRAYAYLTYPPKTKLNDNAQKRLEVMETLDTLGAGFQLASHDMDIRGAGNLLGAQQSGHIKEIGVELYQQMLEDAVAASREGVNMEDVLERGWSPSINLGTSVLIPENYVSELSVRMSLYRRLNDLKTQDDIESFAAELIDRFGDLPQEVNNLLQVLELKKLCKDANIENVDSGDRGLVIGFRDNQPPNTAALVTWIAEQGKAVKLRPDQKIAIVREWGSTAKRVRGVIGIVKEIADL